MISGKIVKIVGVLLLLACLLQPVLAAGTELKDNATEYYDNGEIAISNGQFDQAIQYFDMALADNTTQLGGSDGLMYLYKDKAAALAELGQYNEALKTANTGIIQFPNSTGLWNNKGYIYAKQGDYNNAMDAYNKNIQFADMLAGLVQNHYEDDNSIYWNILDENIESKRLFY